MPDPLFPKSVAYHEAGHVVIAAVLGMRLHARGCVRIDRHGKGVSLYDRRKPQERPGFDLQGKHTVLANFAGLIAQQKFHPSCSPLCADNDGSNSGALLREMCQLGPREDCELAMCYAAAKGNPAAAKEIREAIEGKAPQRIELAAEVAFESKRNAREILLRKLGVEQDYDPPAGRVQ